MMFFTILGSYASLCHWVDGSLEIYRKELAAVLWALYVHCFIFLFEKHRDEDAATFRHRFRKRHKILHLAEFEELDNCSHITHLKSKPTLNRMKYKEKEIIVLGRYTEILLIDYLQGTDKRLLLSLFNKYCTVEDLEKSRKRKASAMVRNDLGSGGVSQVMWGVRPTLLPWSDADVKEQNNHHAKRVALAETREEIKKKKQFLKDNQKRY